MTNSLRFLVTILTLSYATLAQAFSPGDESPFRAQPIAHRGLLLEYPENTLVNFRACLELGVGFEFDVRRTRDGVLVCVHDETVDRTTDGKGQVTELTLEQIRRLDAGHWFHPRFAGERVPTVEEVFSLVAAQPAPTALLAVDLKGQDDRLEADVVDLARRLGVLRHLVFIGRAIDNPDVRRRLRASAPDASVACLAQTPTDLASALNDTESSWVYLRFVPDREHVEQARAAGKRVFVAGPLFASQQSDNWRRAAARGVDCILTDYSRDLERQLREDRAYEKLLRERLRPFTQPPDELANDYGEYASPRRLADGHLVDRPEQWAIRRREILSDWHRLLGGPWPPAIAKPEVRVMATEKRTSHSGRAITQQQVAVEVLPGQGFANGHLLVPEGPGPFPAVVVTFYESRTSAGLEEKGRGTHDYGWQLAQRGFVALCIGTPGSVEFPQSNTRELLQEAGQRFDRQPLSVLAYAAASSHAALAQMPYVDPARIGVIGLSYGGKWAMFASCLHEPFACAVWSDPGIVFNERNGNVNYWEPWYLGFDRQTKRAPGIPSADRPRTGLYRFLHESRRDLHELHALMAPRPVLVSGGTEDPPANWRALNHLRDINRMLGYNDRVAMTSRGTHVPTPEALEAELQFLELHLKYR